MKYFFSLCLIVFFLHPSCAQSTNPEQPAFIRDSLDTYIQKGLIDWNLPGLSVVIVKDGKVVWMKGYGVRDIETKKPVD
ncbi:MAG TPA: serine hydrolase, partial [Chitinophagaceae bacterium]|nr:serine hydrolase [Chitinophagaceae bacterium]